MIINGNKQKVAVFSNVSKGKAIFEVSVRVEFFIDDFKTWAKFTQIVII